MIIDRIPTVLHGRATPTHDYCQQQQQEQQQLKFMTFTFSMASWQRCMLSLTVRARGYLCQQTLAANWQDVA